MSTRAEQLLNQALYDRDDAKEQCLSSIRRSKHKRLLDLSLKLEKALSALPERTKRILKKSRSH